MRGIVAVAVFVALPLVLLAGEPPVVLHQPVPCTIPDKVVSLCANVTAESQVAKVRLYFRAGGQEFYSFVDMTFGGINFCGTLPAPRGGKIKNIEYYIQAVDDKYEAARTSTYELNVQPEGVCEFPPLEKDAGRVASITVYATNKKQGKRLDDSFQSVGVSFVPVTGK